MTSSNLSGASREAALSVLEECTDALAVYQRTLKKQDMQLSRQPAVAIMHNSGMKQKQQQQQQLDIDWQMPEANAREGVMKASHAAFEMAEQEVIFDKLRQDSHWLDQLMHSAKKSLTTGCNIDVLLDEVSSKLAARATEEQLLIKAKETEKRLDVRRQEIADEEKKRRDEEKRLRAELLRLKNEKEKLEIKSKCESSYVKAWLDSRKEQEQLRAQTSREILLNELEQCRSRENDERLVTKRIEAYFRQSIDKNEKSARDWVERRQVETRSYEKEIRRLQDDIEAKRSELELLQDEYKRRQEFIDNCLAEREAARRERELEEHIRGCAIKIQAWWRGVMVRRKLGPYRPEEKKRKRPVKPKK